MDNNSQMNMTYSGIMRKDKKKVVYVRFERQVNGETEFAEAVLPEGTIEKSMGFTPEECKALEFYLKENCQDIFERAQKINDEIFWLK